MPKEKNPVHALTSYFFMINFNIIPSSMSRSPTWFLPSDWYCTGSGFFVISKTLLISNLFLSNARARLQKLQNTENPVLKTTRNEGALNHWCTLNTVVTRANATNDVYSSWERECLASSLPHFSQGLACLPNGMRNKVSLKVTPSPRHTKSCNEGNLTVSPGHWANPCFLYSPRAFRFSLLGHLV